MINRKIIYRKIILGSLACAFTFAPQSSGEPFIPNIPDIWTELDQRSREFCDRYGIAAPEPMTTERLPIHWTGLSEAIDGAGDTFRIPSPGSSDAFSPRHYSKTSHRLYDIELRHGERYLLQVGDKCVEVIVSHEDLDLGHHIVNFHTVVPRVRVMSISTAGTIRNKVRGLNTEVEGTCLYPSVQMENEFPEIQKAYHPITKDQCGKLPNQFVLDREFLRTIRIYVSQTPQGR